MHTQLKTRSLPVPAADCGRQCAQCGSLLSCTVLEGQRERESQSVTDTQRWFPKGSLSGEE